MDEDEKAQWMADNNATFSHYIGDKEVWESPKYTFLWSNGLKGMIGKGLLTNEEIEKMFSK